MTLSTMPIRLTRVVAAVVVGAVVLSGCSTGSGDGDELLVFAAASLTDAVEELASAFEDESGIEVRLNVAGSASLREQVLSGAPVDVFISANELVMSELVVAGEVAGEPIVVASNSMQVVVPADNPGAVRGVGDLARPDLLVGLCSAGVPCGDLAREALEDAGVEVSLDTNEPDVRALLTKIVERELDVAIVYVTDVVAGGDRVLAIDLPSGIDVTTPYPIAALTGSPNPEMAARFVEFVASRAGQSILAGHGFGAP